MKILASILLFVASLIVAFQGALVIDQVRFGIHVNGLLATYLGFSVAMLVAVALMFSARLHQKVCFVLFVIFGSVELICGTAAQPSHRKS